MRIILLFISFFFAFTSFVNAQVYTEKQTRHRFAQMTLGTDYQMGFGGNTQFLNSSNQIENLKLSSTGAPRILIGGTHFWGHADFQISIPIGDKKRETANQSIEAVSGVETSFKYFPWRIESGKIRPYIGAAITPFYYEQDNKNLEFGNGPEKGRTAVPLLMGVTYNHKNHLIELGATWDYRNKQDYFISRTQQTTVTTPPVYAHLSYRFMLETTLEAEKDWESGRTAKITKQLADAGKLNGFFIGAGMSSAWWLNPSSHNEENHPFLPQYNTAIMPDVTVGYYFHNADINVAINHRSYKSSTTAYGVSQAVGRRSFGIEATKYFADYHGFVPFIGPTITNERLTFSENENGNLLNDISENKVSYGVTIGWDIRPNRLQWFLLRTNLRWFPSLEMKLNDGQAISFRNIEFNFIQFVFFPNRVWGK